MHLVEIGSLGKVLPQQNIGFLIRATLPGRIRLGTPAAAVRPLCLAIRGTTLSPD